MITSIDRQQAEERKVQRKFEREQAKNAAQQSAQRALADPDMPRVLESFIGAGQALRAMGRYTEARTSLMTGMEIALRTYYQGKTASLMCGDVGVSKWAHRLRSLGHLDKGSYQTIVAACERLAPYDEQFVTDLVGLARNLFDAVLASSKGGAA